MGISLDIGLSDEALSDNDSNTGENHCNDTDENSDSDGSADQNKEAISDEQFNRTFQRDMVIEYEHFDLIDFNVMYDLLFKEEHHVRERRWFHLGNIAWQHIISDHPVYFTQ